MSSSVWSAVSGSSSIVARSASRPPISAAGQAAPAGPCRAAARARHGAVRDMLDQVEQRRLRPVKIVKHADQRPHTSSLLKRLAHGPAHLLRDPGLDALTQQAVDRSRGGWIPRPATELLQNLHHWPIGDALAVGEAAAAHDGASRPARNSYTSRDLPTPATPSTVTRWHALSSTTGSNASPSSTLCPAGEPCGGQLPARRVGQHRNKPPRHHRSRLALEHQRLDRLRDHAVPNKAVRCIADQHLARSSGLLKPSSHVYGIARSQALLGAAHHVAGLHTNPAPHPQPGSASRIAAAARTARSASSSCTVGTPNTAITASPMNFSTALPVSLDERPHPLEVPGEQTP